VYRGCSCDDEGALILSVVLSVFIGFILSVLIKINYIISSVFCD